MFPDPTLQLTTQLIAFFVASALSICSAHLGLVRLIGNGSQLQGEAMGVLIVVEFALVILVFGPLPIAWHLLDPDSSNQLQVASSLVAAAIFLIVIVDWWVGGFRNKDLYYQGVSSLVALVGLLLLAVTVLNWCAGTTCATRARHTFFIGLAVALAAMATQVFKSAVRFARTFGPKATPAPGAQPGEARKPEAPKPPPPVPAPGVTSEPAGGTQT
jgi:hypothetical protein